MRLPGQRQVRQEVTVQSKLMRQTGSGNSLVRDQPGDGPIDDPHRANFGNLRWLIAFSHVVAVQFHP